MAYVGLNIPVADPPGGGSVKHDRVGNVDTQVSKVAYGGEGTVTEVTTSTPLPVTSSQGGAAVSTTNPLPVTNEPLATSGSSMHKTVSAGTTNATVVKASPGRVMSIVVNNVNAAVRYLKLYNKATAPTVGTDVPAHTIAIPAASLVSPNLGSGLFFSAGISFALTTEATDAGTTAVSANEHVVNIGYK